MYRCPGCGIVHKLPLNENYSILSGKNMDVYHVVKEPFYKEEGFAKGPDMRRLARALSNMHKVESLEEAVAYVEAKGESVESDATCYTCQETNTVEDWVLAFNRPIDFFDAENLCSCGGELWMDRVPMGNRYAMICEKCGWFMPNLLLSGSADAKVK